MLQVKVVGCPWYESSKRYTKFISKLASSRRVMHVTSRGRVFLSGNHYHTRLGGERHDPQRFMGKTVHVPHFNRDTVEFASRERDESKPGIKTLPPFMSITEESNLENSQDLIVTLDACHWLRKVISISLSRFGDDQRCDFRRRFPASQKILVLFSAVLISIFLSQSEKDL